MQMPKGSETIQVDFSNNSSIHALMAGLSVEAFSLLARDLA